MSPIVPSSMSSLAFIYIGMAGLLRDRQVYAGGPARLDDPVAFRQSSAIGFSR